MNLSELSPPPDLPSAEARIPGVALRALLVIIGLLLSLAVYGSSGWIAVGVVLSLLAATAPDFLCAWMLILFLALGQLVHHDGLRWQLLVLLAGFQLLHMLGALVMELPWRSWIEPAVLAAALRFFVAVQIPSQALAVVALLLLAPPAHGQRPLTLAAFSVIGALALAGLALALLWPARGAAQSG